MHGTGGMEFGMAWYWILGIVLVVLVLGFIIRSNYHNTPESQSKSALDILKQRYARGEIDKEEFEERKNRINQS